MGSGRTASASSVSSPAVGRLFENRIVVWDVEASRTLFKEAYYGKPLGIPKPKDADFDAPLILDLMEGYYLMKNKKLRVRGIDGKTLSMEKMEEICVRSYSDFGEKYLVYTRLKEAGFVVAPGIKFGSDFAVYEHGPGIDHAPYIVQVEKSGALITATDMVRSGRLATTVRKQFIIAVANAEKGRVDFLAFDWWRA
ncbi:MAG: tRNA-intron lyase [Thaumarchaeota archaeon]|nr:tRNA-intron lyase [Nitrososphaerota archaeon]